MPQLSDFALELASTKSGTGNSNPTSASSLYCRGFRAVLDLHQFAQGLKLRCRSVKAKSGMCICACSKVCAWDSSKKVLRCPRRPDGHTLWQSLQHASSQSQAVLCCSMLQQITEGTQNDVGVKCSTGCLECAPLDDLSTLESSAGNPITLGSFNMTPSSRVTRRGSQTGVELLGPNICVSSVRQTSDKASTPPPTARREWRQLQIHGLSTAVEHKHAGSL